MAEKSDITLLWQPLWRTAGWLLIVSVWVLSLLPTPPIAPGGDKLHHFTAYFALTLLFSQWHPRTQHARLAISFILMGCAIEVIQPLTGSRLFSWLDMLANASGAGAAWLLAASPLGQALAWFESLFNTHHKT
ncbi:MAG: VanZ family protein [Gammaproteobacteria bacterium]|nr:VanZ family protein [Gammaproteobacteria bacterium]